MLSFVSVDLQTGRILADLPDLQVATLKATMMRYESALATLPLDTAPSNWRSVVREGATAIVCLDEDEVPLWGGYVNEVPETEANSVSFTIATIEDYFGRRYVGDEAFSQVPQNLIVKQLVERYVKTGVLPGIPIRVQIDGGNGVARDRTYRDRDDKTVASILDDLSGVQGGPEWAVEWEWNGGLLTPLLRVSDRLGSPPPAGLGPAAWFYLPGDVTSARLTRSFKGSDGANDVMATSSGTDEARPQSARYRYEGDGRPTFEFRWSPSTSITEVSTLNAHASRALEGMRRGAVTLTITSTRSKAPRLGKDWRLGDDIGFSLVAPAWPNGLEGVARAVGWELDDTTVTPIVAVPADIIDALDDAVPAPVTGKSHPPLWPSSTTYPGPGAHPGG